MKIVVIGTRGFPNVQGGVEKHCEKLYPRLVKLGCEVTVLARQPYVGSKEYVFEGVRVVPVPCPKNKFLEAIEHTRRAVSLAAALKPDIVHVHAIGPGVFVPQLKKLGLKVVMTSHGPDYLRKKWNWLARIVLKMGEARGCRNADQVIAVAGFIVDRIKRMYGVPAEVFPNGIERVHIAETDSALKRYGLEKGKYVLAVGRFVEEKGFHDLVEAIGQYKLVICGDADHEDVYSRRLKRKAAANPNVVLTGFISGVPLQELFSHAGLFVLPSYYEGLPIALLEAMSYGLSCVASDIPSSIDARIDKSRLFKPGDTKALSCLIVRYMDSPLTPEEKQTQFSVVADLPDWDRIAQLTYGVYKKVLSHG